MNTTLTVFDIGFTVGIDGPGQRMVVYLKGCNMRCPWCASPESISPQPEVLFYPRRVENQAELACACPFGAITLQDGIVHRAITSCQRCDFFACAASGNPAFELVGKRYTISELVEKARQYRLFFAADGGVTVGGGEPTCQFASLAALLSALHAEGIHTALETNGTSRSLPELFPLLDMLYIDLKHPDHGQCIEITGIGNGAVVENIRARYAQGGAMVVRMPFVPGYNADAAVMHAAGRTLADIGPLQVELLPYHRRGEVKWHALGQQMPTTDIVEPEDAAVQQAREILRSYGLQVR